MSKTLQDWLKWQETLHPSEIDLGLERVRQVAKKLLPDCGSLSSVSLPCTVITIAGTNGKGSTVAMLESVLCEAGYRVGSYTSPHLLHYNERIKINQQAVTDQLICDSFERIDRARGEISLTYFEFGTLAAIDIIQAQNCTVAILEVGLGGRLDAVNVIEPDIALVTTVDLDHQDWLGSDRNAIGLEKAGIYRQHKPAIYGDSDLPDSMQKLVLEQKLNFFQFSVDYHSHLSVQSDDSARWDWLVSALVSDKHKSIKSVYQLPLPALKGSVQLKNAANVLMVLSLLKDKLPLTQSEISRGMQRAHLAGRLQIVSTDPFIILDVAHNAQAAQVLRQSCEQLSTSGKLHVIIGMLNDKDVTELISIFAPIVDSWRVIELNTPRAMAADDIAAVIRNVAKKKTMATDSAYVQTFADFAQAFQNYLNSAALKSANDILLVFGSFYTVTDALQTLENNKSL